MDTLSCIHDVGQENYSPCGARKLFAMLHGISFLSDTTLVPFTSVSFIFRVAKWDGHLFILYYNNNLWIFSNSISIGL